MYTEELIDKTRETLNNDNDGTMKAMFDHDEMMKQYAIYKAAHTPVKREHNIGRNDLCPCGSGKKYKNCCLSEGTYENYVTKK